MANNAQKGDYYNFNMSINLMLYYIHLCHQSFIRAITMSSHTMLGYHGRFSSRVWWHPYLKPQYCWKHIYEIITSIVEEKSHCSSSMMKIVPVFPKQKSVCVFLKKSHTLMSWSSWLVLNLYFEARVCSQDFLYLLLNSEL